MFGKKKVKALPPKKIPDANLPQQMSVQTVKVSKDQYELIKRTVAKTATDDEFKMFLYQCQRKNVHPLDKLIHFVKYKNKDGTMTVSMITSIDLYRIKAYETGLVDGILCDETRNTKGGLTGAVCKVYRKDMKFPIVTQAVFNEYNTGRKMWQTMPSLMIKKCAEALALRQAFPDALHGIYIAEEMDQAKDGVKQGEYIEPQKKPGSTQPVPPANQAADAMKPAKSASPSKPKTNGYSNDIDGDFKIQYSTNNKEFIGKRIGDLNESQCHEFIDGVSEGSFRDKVRRYIEKRFNIQG